MLALLRRMGREDLTVHGFRSSFRDWAAEVINFPARRSFRNFEKRGTLMQAWAEWCERVAPATVTPIWQERPKATDQFPRAAGGG